MPKRWQRVSNKNLFKGIAFLSLVVVLSHIKAPLHQSIAQEERAPNLTDFPPPSKGVMVTALEHKRVPLYLSNFNDKRLMMRLFANRVVGIMAKASDKRIYYANGFLQGFVPFKITNAYHAMNFIAMRLQYQYDEKQFGGITDLWQTSREAYVRMRGDCEDHAILLADWLESLGFDARVAIGTYKGDGHAWVVWFDKGEAYIIEATNKRSRRSYPLAKTLHDYKAYFMFNKESFWENPRPHLLDDYMMGWYKTAAFKAL